MRLTFYVNIATEDFIHTMFFLKIMILLIQLKSFGKLYRLIFFIYKDFKVKAELLCYKWWR